MKISKEQANENRRRVVGTASRLFRQRGFDGVAVAELMTASGFTHGGFYNHFRSKEALAAEALEHAFAEMADERERSKDIEDFVSQYLSEASRNAPGRGCPAAALAADTSRQPNKIKAVFADGVEGMIRFIEQRLSKGSTLSNEALRERAVEAVAKIVGALALARAMPKGSPLAHEILAVTREACLRGV
jgi:TetR/AcrR family transcriptional regulator, transcriptional repressor for nem operon